MYLTYEEYQNMGGTLEETTFNDLEFEAESLINWYTFNRLKNETELPEEVQKCMKYLINILAIKAGLLGTGTGDESSSAGGSSIASQSNDGVSISYNVLSASELLQTQDKEIQVAINRYLQGVMNSLGQKVLYRGIYPNE